MLRTTSSLLRTISFGLGLTGFVLLCGAGVYQSLRADKTLPPIKIDYVNYINDLLLRGEQHEALHQMRLATQLEVDYRVLSPTLLEQMARLAHDLGDGEAEAHALRHMARANPRDVEVHLRLAQVLLSGGVPQRVILKEASDHCEMALHLRPNSGQGYFQLGVVAEYFGDPEQADALFARALGLEPRLSAAHADFLRTQRGAALGAAPANGS